MSGNEPATLLSSRASKTSLEDDRFYLLCLFSLQHKVTGGDSANGVLGCLTTCSEKGQQGPRGGSPEGWSPEGGPQRASLQRAGLQRGTPRGQESGGGVSRGHAGSLHCAARSPHGPSGYIQPEGGLSRPAWTCLLLPCCSFSRTYESKMGSPKEQASNSRGSGLAGETTEP